MKFDAQSLKRQFLHLSPVRDFILAPMIDVLAESFFQELKTDLPKYDFSDFKKEYTPMFSPFSFKAVLDGKIVSIGVGYSDIDVEDEGETWHVIDSVFFDATDKEIEKRAIDKFEQFVAKFDYGELRAFAVVELNKGKTYHLSSEMYNFYFDD